MDKRKALELLKQALIEIPELRKLHKNNQEFKLWQARVDTIIKRGLASDDYENFDFVQAKYFPDELEIDHLSLEEDYLPKLNDYETALKSIIQKYEILGIEEKAAPIVEPPKTLEDYEEKAGKELELILDGTPDMVIECIMNFVKTLSSKGYLYKCTPRIGDTPDYTKRDKTYSARCDVLVARKDGDVKIGTIKLQLLPKERTLFSIQKLEQRDSPLGRFLDQLLEELKRLGFICFKEEGEEMDKNTAIELLKQYLEEITRLRNLPEDNQEWTLWVAKVENVVKAGLEQEDLDTCTSARYKSNVIPVWGPADFGKPRPKYYQENITAKEMAIKKIIQKYEILGTETQPAAVTGLPPKAFIAHGGETPALSKLKNYLTALGIQPIIVEEQPSRGRSIGENVDWYARQADFAIILATKGDKDAKTGSFIPRGNVLIEIGKAQELFPDRTIYLLQAGTKFPSNISEKVWARFTPQSMDDSFIKIAKEIRDFGILKSIKPPKETSS
ncbi:MAG: TIR domain-containing protein [Dehalococcoidales bacterium]